MLRYAITGRLLLPGKEKLQPGRRPTRQHPPQQPRPDPYEPALLDRARRLAGAGVDVLQLREKDLSPPDLQALATHLADHLRPLGAAAPTLLLNGSVEIAIKAGFQGVHFPGRSGLPAGSGLPGDLNVTPESRSANLLAAHRLYARAGLPPPLTSTSCHSIDDVRLAHLDGFDLLLFGPVFEKRVNGQLVSAGLGLSCLREAYLLHPNARLLALGGVTEANAPWCIEAGAVGVAGIRLFL